MLTNILAKGALLGLICGIACDAEPQELPLETEQAIEPEEDVGESVVAEDGFRASYECLDPEHEMADDDDDGDGDDYEPPQWYCLAKCEGKKWMKVSKAKPEYVKELWCEERAEEFCKSAGEKLEDSCFGVREED